MKKVVAEVFSFIYNVTNNKDIKKVHNQGLAPKSELKNKDYNGKFTKLPKMW